MEMGCADRAPHRPRRRRLDARLLRGRATPPPSARRGRRPRGLDARGHRRRVPRRGPARTCDVVVLSCVGGTVQAMLHGLEPGREGGPRRPVVVTGYVGVVYEKLADGLLLRAGADVVLANCATTRAASAPCTRASAPRGTRRGVALPFLEGEPYRPSGRRGRSPWSSPCSPPCRTAAPTARTCCAAPWPRARHPEREVLIKLRSKPGEHTTHIEELPYQKLVRKLGIGRREPQARLRAHGRGPGPTDLLVTVSSTAALESLHRCSPPRSSPTSGSARRSATTTSLGSGCLASWDQLDAGQRAGGRPEWAPRQGVGAATASTPSTRPRAPRRRNRPASPARPPAARPVLHDHHRTRLSARRPRPPRPPPGRVPLPGAATGEPTDQRAAPGRARRRP